MSLPYGLPLAATVLTVTSVAGLAWRWRDGRFRPVSGPPAPPADPREPDGPALASTASLLARLGVEAGPPVTLLQFSSAFCAPCRVTRALCADVAATVPGVRHVEIDAESHLDEVRALEIWRTPTVLLIDSAGQVRQRASGQPTRPQLLAAVAALL